VTAEQNTNRWQKKLLILSAFAYLSFVIYGSLVPLNVRSLSFEEAWSAFVNIPYLELGIGSRADWVANILLFIPLAFLWQGVIWPLRGAFYRFLSALGLWGACILLSILIEFMQVFFPPRTVSLNDILAEGIGAGIGIIAWRLVGPALLRWLPEWRAQQGASSLCERILWVYLAGLFFYNLMPLDLTISPVEIYHQWKEGRVVLIPFGFSVKDTAQLIYDLTTDIVIWIPVAVLWVLSAKKSLGHIWLAVLLFAVFIEISQLFVYSRVTDVTDILTAAIGGGVGVWIGGRLRSKFFLKKESGAIRPTRSRHFFIGLGGAVLWTGILILIFWYPFDFHVERNFVLERLSSFVKVPFVAYYFGTEFRALTEVFHKILFFVPLGFLLALTALPSRSSLLINFVMVFAMAIIALGIELGQVVLPDKNPDMTDWLLEMLGGISGYWGTLVLHGRLPGSHSRQTSIL